MSNINSKVKSREGQLLNKKREMEDKYLKRT